MHNDPLKKSRRSVSAENKSWIDKDGNEDDVSAGENQFSEFVVGFEKYHVIIAEKQLELSIALKI